MAFGVALDGVIPDYTGLDQSVDPAIILFAMCLILFSRWAIYAQKRQRSDTEDGLGDFLQEEVPVWRPRRSSHRLTVRQLCGIPSSMTLIQIALQR